MACFAQNVWAFDFGLANKWRNQHQGKTPLNGFDCFDFRAVIDHWFTAANFGYSSGRSRVCPIFHLDAP